MFTFGLKSATGTGGGDTYLTGCLAVDVILANQDVDIVLDEKLVDIGSLEYNTNIEVPVYAVDVTPGENDIDITVQTVGLNGCN